MVTTWAPRGALLAFAVLLVLAAPAAANVKPVCTGASYTVESGATLALQGNCTDTDGPAPLTYSLVSGVGFGSLFGSPDGSATYYSAFGYVGPDSFRFQAFDGQDYSDTATVSIDVTAPTAPSS